MQYALFIQITVTCTVPLLGSPSSSDTQLLTLTLAKKNSEQREEQRYAQSHWKRWDSKYQKLERNRRGRGGLSDAGCSAGMCEKAAVLLKKKMKKKKLDWEKKWIWWSWESQLQLDWRNERLITAPRGAGWGPQAHTYCLSFLCGLFQTTSQLEFMITIYNLQVVYFSECTKELSF